jgi:hypothetical protein
MMAASGAASRVDEVDEGMDERARSDGTGDEGRPPDDDGPRASSSWFWRIGFPAAMVVLVVLIPILVLVGRDVVLHSSEGARDEQVTDPAAPGYRALTDPTPTLLVLETGSDGSLQGATVLSLASDTTGGVLFIPAATAPAAGQPSLQAAAASGTDAVRTAVEAAIGAGVGDVTEVPRDAWVDLVAPVAPLTIDNPDDITVTVNGKRSVRFPRGRMSLAAADVPDFLFATDDGASPITLLVRHQLLWNAWLAKVGSSDRDDAVPGEKDSGLGKFVRALAVDRVEVATLPVQKSPGPGSASPLYVPIADQVRTAVSRLIPFPVGSPAAPRVRIDLLDGTGTLDHGLAAAPVLVRADGQIDRVGNAGAFGVATTTLAYRDEAHKADAERLRGALGVGEVVATTDPGGSADVTITLGQDYAASGTRTAGTTPTAGG